MSQSSTSSAPQSTQSNDGRLYKEVPIEPMVPSRKPVAFQIQGVGGSTRAGLSKDCKYAYFYKRQRVIVHQLFVPRDLALQEVAHLSREIFKYVEDAKDMMIQRVSLSGQHIAISTNQKLVVFKMRRHPTTDSSPATTIFTRPYGEWETTGLALHEHDSRLSIVIGQRKRGHTSFKGQVLSFVIQLPVLQAPLNLEPYQYDIPRNDFPKDVDMSMDGTLILCRTQLYNSVIIWDIVSQPEKNAFQITRNFHTPVSVHQYRAL